MTNYATIPRQEAIYFAQSLKKHRPLPGSLLKETDIFNALANAPMPSQRRFYATIPPNKKEIPDTANDMSYVLSLRRVLRNDLAEYYLKHGYDTNFLKSVLGLLVRKDLVYDSDTFTRLIRQEELILKMMKAAAESGHPVSILAALRSTDLITGDVRKRPMIEIPGADLDTLVKWEDAHIQIYKNESPEPFHGKREPIKE